MTSFDPFSDFPIEGRWQVSDGPIVSVRRTPDVIGQFGGLYRCFNASDITAEGAEFPADSVRKWIRESGARPLPPLVEGPNGVKVCPSLVGGPELPWAEILEFMRSRHYIDPTTEGAWMEMGLAMDGQMNSTDAVDVLSAAWREFQEGK